MLKIEYPELYKHQIRCHSCRRVFGARRRDAKYCSNACRQKAHRAAHPPDRSPARREEIARARIAGKRATNHRFICQHCGREFWTDGTGTARRYCSNACRQAAYRARKRAELSETAREFFRGS